MALALCAEHVYVARMTNDVLPTDLEACHRLLREQQGVISAKDIVITECRTALAAKDALVAQQNQQLVEQKERLVEIQLRLNTALQAVFRKRFERYLADPHQLVIDFGEFSRVVD